MEDCVWKTVCGGLCIEDCVWRIVYGRLCVEDCVWRIVYGGLTRTLSSKGKTKGAFLSSSADLITAADMRGRLESSSEWK